MTRNEILGCTIALLVLGGLSTASEAGAKTARAFDCLGGALGIWLEADSVSYPAHACLLSVDHDETADGRRFDARGVLDPGGGFLLEGRVGPDSLDVVLRRGGVVQRLLLNDTTYRTIQRYPDGRTLQRFIDFSEGGLLERLERFEAGRGHDGASSYTDMPLHGIAMSLLSERVEPGDRGLLELLARAPALQRSMNEIEERRLSAGELDALLTTVYNQTAMNTVEPIDIAKRPVSLGCDAYDALLSDPEAKWDGSSAGLDALAQEECRCIEDDQAHPIVGGLSVAVPGLGEVSFAGVEAFTHARCREDDPDCIKGLAKGGITTNHSFGGACENGGTRLLGISATGKGSAQASKGHCLKDTDDFACIGSIRATGVDLNWESECSKTENALCMKAEASVEIRVSLCTNPDSIIPAVESSGSVDGSVGGC